jgi:hypothetical protein
MLRFFGVVAIALIIICLVSFAMLTDDPINSGKPYDPDDEE